MSIRKFLAVLALASVVVLSGCATCRNHPVACGIGVAIVAGSIAASVHHGQRYRPARVADDRAGELHEQPGKL